MKTNKELVVNPLQVISSLHTLTQIKQPIFLWGAPGIGKSQIVAQVAREKNFNLIDIRAVLLDPVDLRGLPRITSDGQAKWCPPSFLPREDSQEKGIVFLDELNAAPPLVQAACYQLVLDRRIGEYQLPDGWTVVAAGNGEKDRAVTHRMPTALANRMVHIEMQTSVEDWLLWAERAEIRKEIIAFLRFRPMLLHDFDPQSQSKAFASPRSWEFISKILDACAHEDVEYELFQGTVGLAAATEFIGFLKIWRDLPTVEDILNAPTSITIPNDPATLYALCEAVGAKTCLENIEPVVEFALRLPTEFSVLLLRTAVCRDENIVKTTPFMTWAKQNSHVLM